MPETRSQTAAANNIQKWITRGLIGLIIAFLLYMIIHHHVTKP